MRMRVVVLVALGGAVALFLLIARPFAGRPSISVWVGGAVERVPSGTTLAEAAARFHLQPGAGDLVDVRGRPLRKRVFPGQILVDGRAVPADTRLRERDRLSAVDGRDRSEGLVREIVRIPGGEPSDPQFLLARTPGDLVITRGRLSHELVSAEFRPTGKPRIEREVALTFDDGPSPRFTGRVLGVLRRLHAPATFFVVGSLAERYPRIVRWELAAGMAVGNHSYGHPNFPRFERLPSRRLRAEIARGRAALAALGIRVGLFRPPGGSFSPKVVRAARELGQRVVLWSVDPVDWQRGIRAKQIVRRVLRAVRPGSIVVLHDGGGNRSATLKALPAIVRGIRAKGLRLVRIAPG